MKYLLLFTLLLAGCGRQEPMTAKETADWLYGHDSVPIKPFYVMGKSIDEASTARYRLADKNGYQFTIRESKDRYSIGDTIK